MFRLSEYPFLRIAIPLIIGIATFQCYQSAYIPLAIFIVSILCYVIIRRKQDIEFQYKHNKIYALLLFIDFTCIGWFCAFINQPATIPADSLNRDMYIQFKVESIRQRDITTEIRAISQNNDWHGIKLLATLQGNDYKIKVGDIVLCKSRIEKIRTSTVPESFDYAQYMKNNGYLYRLYVERNNYAVISHEKSIHSTATEFRNSIIKHIQQSSLNQETTNFLITILTGDNTFINQKARDSFAKSGLAHILAVSGLHIAIIGLIIAFLLKPLDKIGLKKLRLVVSLILIWAFAYFTGLSPSATRAAIMVTFVITAIIFQQKHSVLNALCGSAVLILIANPSSLFNIGFQLSYLSVLGIVIFADKMTFGKRFSWKKKITSLIAVSISAQIGTMLIILYYFNTIPITFLIGNILVVPMLPIFVFLAIIILILTGIGIYVPLLSSALDIFYLLIRKISDLTNSIPFSSISGIWIDQPTVVLLYIAIILFGVWINCKNRHSLYLHLSSISIILSLASLIYHEKTIATEGIFITDGYDSTNLVYYEGTKAYIVNSMNDQNEIQSFIDSNNRFFIRHHIDSIHIATTDSECGNIKIKHPYVSIRGIRFAFISGNLPRKYLGNNRINLDYLILTKRFYNDISTLQKYFTFHKLIIPCEIYGINRDALIQEATNSGIETIDMEFNPVNMQFS